MKKVFCKLGFHKWKFGSKLFKLVGLFSDKKFLINDKVEMSTRLCEKCGKYQYKSGTPHNVIMMSNMVTHWFDILPKGSSKEDYIKSHTIKCKK